MIIRVQDHFKNQTLELIKKIDLGGSFFKILDKPDFKAIDSVPQFKGAVDSVLYIGNLSYLKSIRDNKDDQKILISSEALLEDEDLSLISKFSKLHVIEESNFSKILTLLEAIKFETEKHIHIQFFKSQIQKKRKELELLNNQLSNESRMKIDSLEKSHIEETEKNQKEKSLLHFLDFIQSESIGEDFIEKMFRFIWKDLKKNAHLNLIGLSILAHSKKAKILFYDGNGESTTIAHVDFSELNISKQLAMAWGRPVGKIMSWKLSDSSRESYLFLEVVDDHSRQEKINSYITERLAVLSMYLDRWMIEKEMEVVVDRWKNTFKSFSGSTHVIDEDFKIYQSNYPHKTGEACYKILALRESPCEQCPVLKNQNTNFVLKEGMSVKTYFSQFKFQFKKYYFVIYEDVTKLNLLRSHIIQTEKMSTLGRLGNHLAHELNNPLTGIKSYVQTLLEDPNIESSLPTTARADLNEILKAAVRCQKIIKNFIDFSQKKEPSLEKIQFSEVMQNTLVLLKSALRPHRLFVDLKNDFVLANSHDLQQVLFNLIKNSCQAMQTVGNGSGVIKIYQEIQEITDDLNTKSKIYFHIEDSGPGFSEVILKNIFQPFMTTKEQGEGTGLGLYLSKKLMNNMNADLQVTASSEKGAKISLIFDKI